MNEALDHRKPIRSASRSGIVLFVALSVANASNYLFQVIASRLLGPADYSLMGGIFAVVTVVGVSTSALQTAAAKVVAASPTRDPVPVHRDEVVRRTLRWSIPCAVVFACVSPLMAKFLRAGVAPTLCLALYLAAAPLLSIGFGRVQGLQLFVAFSGLSLGLAAGRLVVTTIALWLGLGVLGVVLASFVVTAAGAWVALELSRTASELPQREMRRDVGRATVAIVLFWIMVSVDVPVARHALSSDQAGQYTAASVIGKAVLWLPGAISLVMFPKVAQLREAGEKTHPLLLRSLALTIALCGAAVFGLWLVGPEVIPVFFGASYEAGGAIAWQVGLVCLPFALANLLIFYHLTRPDSRFAVALAVGLICECLALALFHDSTREIILGLGVGSASVVIGLVLPGTFRRVRDYRGWMSGSA